MCPPSLFIFLILFFIYFFIIKKLGWIPYRGHLYFYSRTNKHRAVTYRKAQEFCRSEGANLVSITSVAENNFIFALDPYASRLRWLGGKRDRAGSAFSPYSWEWEDGSSFDLESAYTRSCPKGRGCLWLAGQPDDNNGKEDCLVMGDPYGNSDDLVTPVWHDANCAKRRHFVCKKALPEFGVCDLELVAPTTSTEAPETTARYTTSARATTQETTAAATTTAATTTVATTTVRDVTTTQSDTTVQTTTQTTTPLTTTPLTTTPLTTTPLTTTQDTTRVTTMETTTLTTTRDTTTEPSTQVVTTTDPTTTQATTRATTQQTTTTQTTTTQTTTTQTTTTQTTTTQTTTQQTTTQQTTTQQTTTQSTTQATTTQSTTQVTTKAATTTSTRELSVLTDVISCPVEGKSFVLNYTAPGFRWRNALSSDYQLPSQTPQQFLVATTFERYVRDCGCACAAAKDGPQPCTAFFVQVGLKVYTCRHLNLSGGVFASTVNGYSFSLV